MTTLARSQGWQMVDSPSAISDGRASYLPGMTSDRMHPTPPAARVIGAALRSALIS